jgi:hypothetical protein
MATTLNAIKPLFFLAEADSYQALLQSAFVSDYNLPFLYSFLNSVGQGGASKGNFTSQVQRLKSYYPANTYPVNFITNHDWNAWYGTEFERMGCEGLDRDGRCTSSPAVAATTTLTALGKKVWPATLRLTRVGKRKSNALGTARTILKTINSHLLDSHLVNACSQP